MSKVRVDWQTNGRQSNIMRSVRFNRPIVVTRHAAQRMAERSVPDDLLVRLIDEGDTRYSDETHLWAWLNVAGRDDNLLCLALFLENAVIVKTVCTDGS